MKIVIGVVVGGAAGFLLGHFSRCAGGGCPLAGNPYVSTVVGAVIGGLVAGGI
ncbi:MAG: DUF6132 family protein [bacterium]|nr:DUF6132 family protein [bacterium]